VPLVSAAFYRIQPAPATLGEKDCRSKSMASKNADTYPEAVS